MALVRCSLAARSHKQPPELVQASKQPASQPAAAAAAVKAVAGGQTNTGGRIFSIQAEPSE